MNTCGACNLPVVVHFRADHSWYECECGEYGESYYEDGE